MVESLRRFSNPNSARRLREIKDLNRGFPTNLASAETTEQLFLILTFAKTRTLQFLYYTAAASDLGAERAAERIGDLQYRCGVLLGGNVQ